MRILTTKMIKYWHPCRKKLIIPIFENRFRGRCFLDHVITSCLSKNKTEWAIWLACHMADQEKRNIITKHAVNLAFAEWDSTHVKNDARKRLSKSIVKLLKPEYCINRSKNRKLREVSDLAIQVGRKFGDVAFVECAMAARWASYYTHSNRSFEKTIPYAARAISNGDKKKENCFIEMIMEYSLKII